MEQKSVSSATLVCVTIIMEALLLLAATIWLWFSPALQLGKHMHIDMHIVLIGIGAGLLLVCSSFFAIYMGKYWNVFAQLRKTALESLSTLVANLGVGDIVLIAVISGFCEEVFFRGVLQPTVGIFFASAIFAIFHDPFFRNISYLLFAFLASLLLGALYISTGSLWAPAVCHIVNNLISLFLLRYAIKPPADAPEI